MEEKNIVNLLWERDSRALTEMSEKYGKLLYTVANNILHSHQDSEEAVNDTNLGAWNAIPPQKPERLSSFLCKITRNLSLKKWREKSAEKRGGGNAAEVLSELSECIPAPKTIDDEIETKELARVISAFLHSLKKDESAVFVCRYFYLYSVAEISQKFGFSESRVKTGLMRTRNKLLAHLEKEGIEL